MSVLSWFISLIMSALLIGAQISIKSSLKIFPSLDIVRAQPFHSVFVLACQPLFWLGILLSGIIFILTLYQYMKAPLNVFVPSITITYTLLLALGSIFILREPFSWKLGLGYILMVAASILIATGHTHALTK
ncbi:MAG: hypothetical protein ABFD69_13585 [Candidatus Sumerlaeia bacterium]